MGREQETKETEEGIIMNTLILRAFFIFKLSGYFIMNINIAEILATVCNILRKNKVRK